MDTVTISLTKDELTEILLALDSVDLENPDYCSAKEKIEQAIVKLEPEEG